MNVIWYPVYSICLGTIYAACLRALGGVCNWCIQMQFSMPSLIANLNSEMLFCHEAFMIFPELFTDFERKFSVNTWEGANTRYIIMCRRQKNYTCMHIRN